MKPIISILLIFYNDDKYIAETIKSIINQTFKDFELIMLDNGSTDNSYKIASEYEKQDSRIKIIRIKQNYHNGSLNFRKLLDYTNGKYIKLFCADDILEPHCLQTQKELLDSSNYIACFSHMKCINDNSKLIKTNYNSVIKNNRYEYLNHIFYSHQSFAFPTVMVKKSSIEKSMLDPRLIHFSDVKLWIELLKKGEVKILDQYLVKYRIRGNQGNVSNISENKKKSKSYIFELHLLYEEFFKIKDFKEFTKIFPEGHMLTDKLDQKKDKDLLPFITAILLYNSEQFKPFHFSLRRNIALLKIFDIIKNEKLMSEIEKKLGFTNLSLYKLTSNFCEGIDICYSRQKRNILHKLWYKLVTRNKYKKLKTQNQIILT